ncbi:hypothetical protein KFE98_13275 [bacterium SCSIO 12741]|nr:hypothetical protein KFE98_13275 [bacterium SCSIO 12741]
MKYRLIVLLALLPYLGLADCTGDGFWVYPADGILREDGWIMIEGYAESRRMIDSINASYQLTLESEGHQVKMQVMAHYRGQYSLDQVLVKPMEKLKVNETYTLHIATSKGEKIRNLSHFNPRTDEYEPLQWTVEKSPVNRMPSWPQKPKWAKHEVNWYGCGPAVYTVFDLGYLNKGTWVKVELVELETQTKSEFYLRVNPRDGLLYIGHGMCSGAFNFKQKHGYKVRFGLLSYSGVAHDKRSRWITFSSPFDQVGSEF